MKRNVICLAVLVALVAPTGAQHAHDVLYLQDGLEHVGELVRMSPDEIVFWIQGEDEPRTFPRDEIKRLDLTRQREGDSAKTVAELDDPLLDRLLAAQPTKLVYPDSGYVTMYRLHDFEVADDGTYTLRERRVIKVLLERGKDQANVARYFKKGEETLDIDFARTINPDGSVTPISDAGVDITSVHSSTPEYEKLYQKKFAMKQLKVGSVLDYQVTKRRLMAGPLDPFYVTALFRADEPILEAELRISVPAGRELIWHEDRLGSNVATSKDVAAGRTIYRVVARNCQRVVPEPMMPPAGDLYPRVTAALADDWASIADAYAAAMRSAAQPGDEIRTKVAALVADAASPREKAQRVYRHFVEAVRQLWVPPSSYSYAPRPVGEVYANRAGNAIDKAMLLATMLNEAGLDSGVVLACPQGNGELLADVPNIRQFSDALVAVDLPDGRVLLPVYDESVRFGQMPAGYQGTRGLLVKAGGGQLIDVPLNDPSAEGTRVTYRMALNAAGDLAVEKTEEYFGNDEVSRRNAWKDQKDEELRRSFEMGLTAMHPKARLDDYTIENLRDVTQPLRFIQKYTLVDYAMRAGDDLLVFQLPEIAYEASSVGKPTREFPMKWYRRSRNLNRMEIAVPAGFTVYYAGKDYADDCGIVAFEADFSTQNGTVRYADTFTQNELWAAPAAYPEYKETVETMARVPKEWVVLERAAK